MWDGLISSFVDFLIAVQDTLFQEHLLIYVLGGVHLDLGLAVLWVLRLLLNLQLAVVWMLLLLLNLQLALLWVLLLLLQLAVV